MCDTSPRRLACSMLLRSLALILLCAFSLSSAGAEPFRVAVASNFLVPARALADRFEQASGHQSAVVAGSTGKLYAQIVNGAPFDVFLAANASEPKRLEADGKAVTGSRFTYAVGRLVLWSRDPALLTASKGADLIRSARFGRLAIANPKTAPYGAAAVQTMQSLGLDLGTLGPRLLLGENVSQAYQFVASGNADLGFVALSQVSNPDRHATGSHWLVPANLHHPIEQQAILLARAEREVRAASFLDYLRGPQARELIARYGYGTL
jgi:molybdate transport system substrate-binding protein